MLIAWAMALMPGTGWMTGSLWGPIGIGFFNSTQGLEGLITFETWSNAILLPAELVTILFVIGLYIVMKPDEPLNICIDSFNDAYKELGPMRFPEIITLIIC